MKFPVIKAFGATFAYLARHGIDLAKSLWLPTALLVALQLYAMTPFLAALSGLVALGDHPESAEAEAALGAVAKWGLVLVAGSAIAYPMMTVASLRHLVCGDALKAPFYLRYGGDELRVLAAYILISLMIVVITIVGGLGASVIALVLTLAIPQARELLNALGELAVNVVILWFRLRLSALYPASIATGTIGFGASWSVTKGNVWGLFFFAILIGLTLIPVAALAIGPFVGDFLPLFAKLSEAGEDPVAAREAVIPILDALGKLFSPESPTYALFVAALFLSTAISTAVFNVAAGTAWRYLTDREKPAPAASQAMAA